MASIVDNGLINANKLDKVYTIDSISKQYITQYGDIVVRLSYPNIAVYIDTNCEGILIPSQFAIIRINNNSILSEYVSTVINSTDIQKQFRIAQNGTVIKVINTTVVKNLKIEIQLLKNNKRLLK